MRGSRETLTRLAPIAVGVLVGLVMVLSPVLFRVWAGDAYRGIGMILSPQSLDGAWYHAVVREGMEGGKPWNAILAETKHAPYPVPDLAERVMALPGRILDVRADTLLLFWRFFLPFILTLVIFMIGYRLTRGRMFALAASVGSVLLSFFVALLHTKTLLPFTLYDRPVHPQFEAPVLWIFLFLATGSRRWMPLVAGVLLGFLTHTYFWAWTWGYSALGALLLIAGLQRSRSRIVSLAAGLGTALVIGAPKIFALLQAFFGEGDPAYPERLAAYSGHAFASWNLNLPVVLALVLVILRHRFADPRLRLFLVTGLSATFIALNQQIVTGISLQPDHYLLLIGAVFSVWAILWVAWTFLRDRSGWAQRLFCLGTLVCSVGAMGFWQFTIFRHHRDHAQGLQPFSEVASWLNAHADSDYVVFANMQTGLLVPMYTRANLWWHFYALAVPQDDQRVERSAFVWLALFGIEPSQLEDVARRQPVEFTQLFTLSTLREQRLELLDRRLAEWKASYETFRRDVPLAEAVRAYRVDAVLHDKHVDRWDPAQLVLGEKLLENERFVLWSVTSTTK